LYFHKGEIYSYQTTSAKYSLEFARRLQEKIDRKVKHIPCRRVVSITSELHSSSEGGTMKEIYLVRQNFKIGAAAFDDRAMADTYAKMTGAYVETYTLNPYAEQLQQGLGFYEVNLYRDTSSASLNDRVVRVHCCGGAARIGA
jgi:hypothetical protein